MFGIQSQGKKNYSKCVLKKVTSPGDGLGQASLECPMTGEQGFTTRRQTFSSRALPHLANMAAKSLCGECPLAGMSVTGYQQYRVDAAAAEEQALQAEHRLALTRLSLQQSLAREHDNIISEAAERMIADAGGPEQQPPAGGAPELPPTPQP